MAMRAGKGALAALLVLASAGVVDDAQAAVKRRAAPKRKAAAASEMSGASALVKAGLDKLDRKDYSGAIDIFGKAARAQGDSAVYFLLGYAHYQRGFLSGDSDTADKRDAAESVNAFTTALALDPKLEAVAQPYKLYHSLGLSYEALGEHEKAVDAYRKAFQAAPSNPMLPLYAARLRWRMNDMGKSLSNLDVSLRKASQTGQLDGLLKALKTEAGFSAMLGSAEHLAVVRKYDPSASAPQALAALAQGDGTMRDAVKGTTPGENREATMRRQDKDVLDALSAANDEYKFRRFRQAIDGYQDALRLNEASGILSQTQIAFVWERVGSSYNKLGLAPEAVKALRRCVQAAPMSSAAHYQLSLAYAVLGRYLDSMHALRETLRNAPSTGELKRYMLLAKTDSELEGVRGLPAFAATIDEHKQRAVASR